MTTINVEIKINDDEIKDLIFGVISKYNNVNSQNEIKAQQTLVYQQSADINLYTVKEVSKIFKTDEITIRSLIDKQLLKALKLGRLKIRGSELQRFLDYAEGKDFSDLNNIKDLNKV